MRFHGFVPLALALALAAGPAWAGHDDHGKKQNHGDHDRDRGAAVHVDIRIGEPQRVVVHDYYVNEIHGGHCPPGLAKKHNGCMPPGLAKKRWQVGHRLPRDVIFYDLPPRLVVKLGPPPAGYRYARIANDVLLIAIGTGMVMDAITDLGKM